MSLIAIVHADLLTSNEQYIGHQCNCVSKSAAGLAKALFKKYPYANDYKNRKYADIPGTATIHGNGKNKRFIVNLFGQFEPGAVKSEPRTTWFRQALNQFASLVHDQHITFGLPYNIGCGLAGGNWAEYLTILDEFVKSNPNIQLTLYKYEP